MNTYTNWTTEELLREASLRGDGLAQELAVRLQSLLEERDTPADSHVRMLHRHDIRVGFSLPRAG